MNVPKYIYDVIEKRATAADRFNHYDYVLSEWLEKHGICAEPWDTRGGVESIVNPWSSADRIIKLLKDAEDN